MDQFAYAEAKSVVTERPMLDALEQEISRLEQILNMTEAILNPVLESIAPDSLTHPEEAPITDMHNLVLRLRRQNSRAEDLRSRIRL